MKVKINLRFYMFLDHFNSCGGCIGHRSVERCRYAEACRIAEELRKSGVVSSQDELLMYGVRKD